jgi:hypothetical protein
MEQGVKFRVSFFVLKPLCLCVCLGVSPKNFFLVRTFVVQLQNESCNDENKQ